METSSGNAAENRLTDINEQQTSPDRPTVSTVTTASVGNVNRIPIRVVSMHTGNSKLGINTTPRIDISRASSTSQQGDSRDSSPDNVFEQVMCNNNWEYRFLFVKKNQSESTELCPWKMRNFIFQLKLLLWLYLSCTVYLWSITSCSEYIFGSCAKEQIVDFFYLNSRLIRLSHEYFMTFVAYGKWYEYHVAWTLFLILCYGLFILLWNA